MRNPSQIKNKAKRAEVYAKFKEQKKKLKKKLREMKVAEVEALGAAAPPKKIPTTIENTRNFDATFVKDDDLEIVGDEKDDEFSSYFTNEKKPKIMISTRPKCSRKLFLVIADLMQMIPNAFYYPREQYTVKELCDYAMGRNFTHLVILGEKKKVLTLTNSFVSRFLVTHLPVGPTAYFSLSSFEQGSKIPGHGRPTSHVPEVILNNFVTRL
eukprot:gene30871-39760_t